VIAHETGTRARAVFTTRVGGESGGPFSSLNLGASTGDAPGAVRRNRLVLCRALGIDADRVSMCRQVHGDVVHRVERPARRGRFAGGLVGWLRGDAMVTVEPWLPLLVLGADCLPVLLWRRDIGAVAAAHAGWRGLVGGVVERAVATLGAPAAVAAIVGPGIGPARYEVDDALRSRFASRFGEGVVHGRAVDLASAALAALADAGVPRGRITLVEACTYEEPERWFSHRRDGPRTGRQAGLIWLEADR